MVDVEDGFCSSMAILDGTNQLWTSTTCDGQNTDTGLVKKGIATTATAAEVASVFAALPQPPDLTCPGDGSDAGLAGGRSSGTAILLNDGTPDSFVTLEHDTNQSTDIWAACQTGGALLPPFNAAADELRTLVGQ